MIDIATIYDSIMKFVPYIVSWLLTYSIHSTLLLLIVWIVSRFTRSQNLQDTLWKLALVGALLTTTFQIGSGVEPIAGRHTISTEVDNPSQLIEKLEQHTDLAEKAGALSDSCISVVDNDTILAITATVEDSLDLQWVSNNFKQLLPGQISNQLNIDSTLIAAYNANRLAIKKLARNSSTPISSYLWKDNNENEKAIEGLTIHRKKQPLTDTESAARQKTLLQVGTKNGETPDSTIHAISSFSMPNADFVKLNPDGTPGAYELIFNDFSWIHWVLIVWLLGVLFSGARFIISNRQLRKLLANRKNLIAGPTYNLLYELCKSSGQRKEIRLTISPKITSPIALGYREICIPERAIRDLDSEQQRTMLAHELAHIVRRDPLWLLFTATLDILLFFQPLNRVARNYLQETAEYLCDDWAIQHTGESLNLAKCLAQVAEWIQAAPRYAYVSGMANGGSALRRRVTRILDHQPEQNRSLKHKWVPILAICILMLIAGSAPIISAEYMKANMYVLYLNQVNIDNSILDEIENSPNINGTANKTMQIKVRRGKFKGNNTRALDGS